MFASLCSSLLLVFLLMVDIRCQTDICSLKEDTIRSLTTVFSVGNNIYLGNDVVFYPLNVEKEEPKQNLSVGQIFPGIEFDYIHSVIHFRGPIPCNKKVKGSCPHSANNLVIVFSRDTSPRLFQTFRYNESSEGLTAIVDNSEMPWGLSTHGEVIQFWDGIGLPKNGGPPEFTSAMYYYSMATIYFSTKTEMPGDTLYLLKRLYSDGSFSKRSLMWMTGVPTLDSVVVDSKGRLFGFTKKGMTFTQLSVNNSKVDSIGQEYPVLEFFNCKGKSPLTLLMSEKGVMDNTSEEVQSIKTKDENPKGICDLKEQNFISNLTKVFSIGSHIYLSSDSHFYRFNVETDEWEDSKTEKELFPHFGYTVDMAVHFRAPLPCENQGNDSCNHLANGLVLAFSKGIAPLLFKAYRYLPSNESLTAVPDNSQMSWNLNTQGLLQEFWDNLNVPAEGRPPIFTSAIYTPFLNTLFFTVRDKKTGNTIYFSKQLLPDGSFNNGSLSKKAGPPEVETMFIDSKGRVFGTTRNENGLTFVGISVNNSEIVLTGDNYSVLKFFKCFGSDESPKSGSFLWIVLALIVVLIIFVIVIATYYLYITKKPNKRADDSRVKEKYTLKSEVKTNKTS